MAHKVLGVDLGSHTVKVVELLAGFRTVQVTGFHTAPVPAPEVGKPDEPAAERAMRALVGLLAAKGLTREQRHEALAGDQLMVRLLALPFSDVKKIDSVVGYELEGQIARDVEDVVFDHRVVPAIAVAEAVVAPAAEAVAGGAGSGTGSGPGAGAGAAPAPGTPATTTKVLVAASLRTQIKERLDRSAGALGTETRTLLGAPLVFGQVARAAGPVGLLDMGHTHTTLSVVAGGVTLFSRTLPRGGRHVTAAIARRYQLDPAQAEVTKHASAFVATRAQLVGITPDQRLVHDLVVAELTPLARDLKQTLAAFRAAYGMPLAGLITCGGASRLQGVGAWLGELLDLPVEPLRLSAMERPELALLAGALDVGGATPELALALAIALEGVGGRAAYDFRQDEFAYKVDYSFLRERAIAILSAFLVLIALAAVMAWAELSKLKKEERLLSDRFDAISQEVLGMQIDPEDVAEHVRPPKADESPIPSITAYDMLDDISKVLPEKDKVKLDITELEIRAKKISLKATVGSAKEAELLEAALKQIKCIGDIQTGRMTAGMNAEEKQFTMTIAHSCM